MFVYIRPTAFMHLSIFCPSGGWGAAGIHGALDRRPFLTGGNFTYRIRSRVIDFGQFFTSRAFDAPSRLNGVDLDKMVVSRVGI